MQELNLLVTFEFASAFQGSLTVWEAQLLMPHENKKKKVKIISLEVCAVKFLVSVGYDTYE